MILKTTTPWAIFALGEVLSVLENGSRPSGGVDQYRTGVPSIGGEHIDINGGFNFSNIKYIPNNFFNNMSRGIIQKKDILVVKDGATTGKVALVEDNFPFPTAAINEHVFILRTNTRVLLPDFAFFFLYSALGQAQIRRSFHGGAIGGINQDFVNLVQIPIPSLLEQEQIVTILRHAAYLVQQRRAASKLSDKLLPALFTDIFGDPATNPLNWPIVKAGDLMISCEYGSSQKSSETNQGIPIIRMNNVTYEGTLYLNDLKYVTLNNEDFQKYALEPGDVLFNRTNSKELVGKTGMWDGQFNAVPASYFIRVRFDRTKEHPLHFVVFMNSSFMKRRLVEMARGAIGQSNINAKELRSLQIPKPPVELQNLFADQAQKLSDLVKDQLASDVALGNLFDLFLARAFSGELTQVWRQQHETDLLQAENSQIGFIKPHQTIDEISETVEPSVPKESDRFDNSLLDILGPVQKRVYDIIKNHNLPYFTVQTLWQEHNKNAITGEDPVAHDVIDRGIRILESLGLVVNLTLLSEPTGEAFYQSVFRRTSAISFEDELRNLKDRFPNIRL